MKTKFLSFLFGGFVFLCLGAGTAISTNILTVKPAKPKLVIVKDFKAELNSSDVAEYIRSKIQRGYIVKSVTGANYATNLSTWVVVLERY